MYDDKFQVLINIVVMAIVLIYRAASAIKQINAITTVETKFVGFQLSNVFHVSVFGCLCAFVRM